MKNFLYFVLILVFVFIFSFIFNNVANAADGNQFRDPNMWQRERTINDAINKSSVKVEAQKTYPVSTLDQNGKPIKQIRNAKATIKLGASTANVGKSLLKRAPAIAITQAVIAILGKSVDWVLDPENNAVRYLDDSNSPLYGQYYWRAADNTHYSTQTLAGEANCRYYNKGNNPIFTGSSGLSFSITCSGGSAGAITRGTNPDYDPDYVGDYKDLPISQIAQKIINHAEEGQAPAMQVMNDAALDALEAGLLDAQLDAASNVPQPDPQEITQAQYDNPDYPENGTGTGTGPETPVDPETPTDPVDPNPNPNPDANPFQLPPFCSWASKVCDFIDWVKTEPPEPPESGEVDVQIPDSNMHEGILERLYINMPAQCPPDPILEFMGAKIPFPMSIFCQFAEMMKPLILLFAYIKGLSIIGNGLT